MADERAAPGRLTPVTAVVTGASRGIGLAIARGLIDAGARVVMIARTESALSAAARQLGERGIPLVCDVSDSAAVVSATARVLEVFGSAPDILVNNAGTFALTPIEKLEPSAFAAELDTNLVAPLRFIHAFLPAMKARSGGHVVTIGSIADRNVFPENASYAPSKFGARALHEILRLETVGSGVRATLVSPGPVDTPIWDAIDADEREGFTPRARMLRPEAVAAAVLYAVTQPADTNVDELRVSRA